MRFDARNTVQEIGAVSTKACNPFVQRQFVYRAQPPLNNLIDLPSLVNLKKGLRMCNLVSGIPYGLHVSLE